MKDIRNDARAVKVGAKGELAKYTLWRRPALKRLYAALLALGVHRSSLPPPSTRARQLIHLRLARFDLMERMEERYACASADTLVAVAWALD